MKVNSLYKGWFSSTIPTETDLFYLRARVSRQSIVRDEGSGTCRTCTIHAGLNEQISVTRANRRAMAKRSSGIER